MSAENWKIQVSPKLPDGTLINIRAESGEELTNLLNYAGQNAQLIADTTALLAGARNATAVTQPGVANPQTQPVTAQAQQQYAQPAFQVPDQPGVIQFPQQQQAQPAQPAAAAGGAAPVCPHGTMTWVAPAGKSWKGWFCPSPKGTPGQCKPQFVK